MKYGYLSDYFRGCAVKTLTAVEADTSRSNQHEFNGVSGLRGIFGSEKLSELPARFIWFGDNEDLLVEEGFLTWYDARERHPRRSEFRLYFPATAISAKARESDTLFIARRADPEGSALVIVAPANSTSVNQLLWLFGMTIDTGSAFRLSEVISSPRDLDFSVRHILKELGIELQDDGENLEHWVEDFDLVFPSTRVFSARARESMPEVDPLNGPDEALLNWMEREEAMFRYMEKQILSHRLRRGFEIREGEPDVDGFIKFSLSVQNRRKSRVGYALENHLEAIFKAYEVLYEREAVTENRAKPDFLFPGAVEYHATNYPTDGLTMLAAKSSCKDRWRQVLSEAERISKKHLLTLEPSISRTQTEEMQSNSLQLIVPNGVHVTYLPEQQEWLMNLSSFIGMVKDRQARIHNPLSYRH